MKEMRGCRTSRRLSCLLARLTGVLAICTLAACTDGYRDVSDVAPYKEYVGKCYRIPFSAEIVEVARVSDSIGGATHYLELEFAAYDAGLNELKNQRVSIGIGVASVRKCDSGLVIHVDGVKLLKNFEVGDRVFIYGHVVGAPPLAGVNLNNAFKIGRTAESILGPGGSPVPCE